MISSSHRSTLAAELPCQTFPPLTAFFSPSDEGPSEEEIALCAFLIWEHEGRPEGRHLVHWEQARTQLIACREHDLWLAAWCCIFEPNRKPAKKPSSKGRIKKTSKASKQAS